MFTTLPQPPTDYRKISSLPGFDGKSDVVTFFTMFDMGCRVMGVADPAVMKYALLGKLTGAA